MADKTIDNFKTRAARLYEQECNPNKRRAALEQYARRWVRWVTAGLQTRVKGIAELKRLSKFVGAEVSESLCAEDWCSAQEYLNIKLLQNGCHLFRPGVRVAA